MSDKVVIWDTTLREGEQQRGIHFSFKAKVEIISALEKYGFADKYEIHCYKGPILREAKRLVKEFGEEKFLLHHRCFKGDIDVASEVGPSLAMFIGISDYHLKAMSLTRESVLEKIREDLEYARERGAFVEKLALEDATRADVNFLERVVKLASECGVRAIGICDTVGVATPREYGSLIKRLFKVLDSNSELLVHCHNDLGLSLANCLAAYEANARIFNVSWHGYGERAGVTPAEQFLVLFERIGALSGVRIEGVSEVSRLISKYSGIHPKPHDPVVGENVFTHKAGVHADKVRRVPEAYEPFPPSKIGRKRRFVLSHISGKSAVYMKLLEDYELEIDDKTAEKIAGEIKEYCSEIGTDPSDSEVEEIVERVLNLERGSLVKRRKYPQLIEATILINVEPNSMPRVAKEIRKSLPEAISIEETLGEFDLAVRLKADSFYAIDSYVDLIRGIDGVEKTTTAIVTKKWK